jgi:AraC family transcriptional activator of pobA
MFDEINTDYIYKYDIAKMLVEELLHLTMKSKSFKMGNKTTQSAAQRLTIQFLELLERQFPIDESQQIVKLRSASEFAEKLNIHVNHLNRAVKETTEKTTSEIIAERILQEAKILLRQSSWNVSEIAYSLGFTEPTHFNNFFKKHTKLSPLKFRAV